jgi:hypothetical protein
VYSDRHLREAALSGNSEEADRMACRRGVYTAGVAREDALSQHNARRQRSRRM